MLRDLRLAWRLLLRNKGWTAVVLISLGLGIGVNTTLFSALNALLLRTLPAVEEPGGLVRLRWTGENQMLTSISSYGQARPTAGGGRVHSSFSFLVYEHLRGANRTLTDLVACYPGNAVNVVARGRAAFASSFFASGNYFQLLGVRAHAGRLITPEDDLPGAPPVAMISHRYWDQRFGKDPAAVGLEVTVNQTPVTIVGVTPPDYIGVRGLEDSAPSIHLPLHLDSRVNNSERLSQPTTWWLLLLGRLKPGVTPEQVRGNLEGVFQAAARLGRSGEMVSAKEKADFETWAVPALDVALASRGVFDGDPETARAVKILAVVALLVLMIVCANVANLLLSKAGARGRELSVRLCVGASRGRLIRQMLTESLLLSAMGGGLALLLAYWSRGLLPFGLTPPLDGNVFAFTAGVSLMTGLAFGLAPALRATRLNLAGSLRDRSSGPGRSRSILTKSLLVLQVAISVVLLIAAGLFLGTLRNLRQVEVGFNTGNLLLVTVNPAILRYDQDRTDRLLDRIREGLLAVPGVQSVSLSDTALLSGSGWSTSIFVPGRDPGKEIPTVHMMTVSPGFFETVEIPILLGRGFKQSDTAGSPWVAVINETAAREYFPEGSPLGRRFGFTGPKAEEIEVVGVIGDTKYYSVKEAAPPTVYQPHSQRPLQRSVTFEIRTAIDPRSTIPAAREAVRAADPELPLWGISTQSEVVERGFADERSFALAYSLFGGLALLLACVGLFGLMSYSVVQRTHEIGVRLALGARRREVIGMVLRESLWLVAVGVGLGLAGAFAAGRFISSFLFDLSPTDPVTWIAAVSLMFLVAAIAGYIPARRASRVDPLVALRCE